MQKTKEKEGRYASFCRKMVHNFIKEQIISAEEEELYVYGLKQGILLIVNIGMIILTGLCFHMLWQSILFFISYAPLRAYAGGYHARTQGRCTIYSFLLIPLVLLMIKRLSGYYEFTRGLAYLSFFVILILAPMGDANKPLDKKEIHIYKIMSYGIGIILMGLMMVFGGIRKTVLFTCLAVSVVIEACMLLIGKIQKIWNQKGSAACAGRV